MPFAAVMGGGLGIELAQAAATGKLLGGEIAFDLAVDLLAGMAGLVLGRRAQSALAVTRWLQARIIAPIALLAVLYARARDQQMVIGWMAVLAGCALPTMLVWHFRGRDHGEETPDTLRRARLGSVALCTLSAGLLLGAALGLSAPASIVSAATVIVLGATFLLIGAFVDLTGSTPITVALLGAVALAPWSPRGITLFVAAAILLSWGHLRLHRYRGAEVLGSWIFAATLTLPRIMLARASQRARTSRLSSVRGTAAPAPPHDGHVPRAHLDP